MNTHVRNIVKVAVLETKMRPNALWSRDMTISLYGYNFVDFIHAAYYNVDGNLSNAQVQ